MHKEENVLNDMSAVYQVLGTTEDFKRLLPVEMKVSWPRFCHFSQNLTLGRCPPKLCSPQFSMMPQHPHSTCLQGRTDPAKARGSQREAHSRRKVPQSLYRATSGLSLGPQLLAPSSPSSPLLKAPGNLTRSTHVC